MRQVLMIGAVLTGCVLWSAPSAIELVAPAGRLDAGRRPGPTSRAAFQESPTEFSAGSDSRQAGPGADPSSSSAGSATRVAAGSAPFTFEEEDVPVHPVWKLREDSPHQLDHPVGDYRPARYGLDVDVTRIRALVVGEAFALPLPGLGVIEATVTWVNQASNGDRGIGAVIDGNDDEYALTLTLGERALFGKVSTDRGRFLIEGTGALAAVFRDDLEQVLVDPNQTDERIPPEVSP